MHESLSRATLAVVAGRPEPGPDVALNPPVVLSSTYHAPGEVGYARYGNPTWSALEEVLGGLDGGSAVVLSSGMAAVDAVLAGLPPGAVVVAGSHLYSGTSVLLDEYADSGRLEVRRVDVADLDAVAAAAGGAALVWAETVTNPLLEEADVPALAEVAHRHGARLVVDSTFSTPVLQRPLEEGADVVVHSATKYLAGHSDVLLGVVVSRDEATCRRVREHRGVHGSVPGPFETWLTLRGVRTLHLRVERAQANARELADRLGRHPAVGRVRYPGRGGVVSVEVRGGAAAADRLVAAVRLWVHATSLGGVESTLERRRRWAEESADVPEALVRLSVGVEDVDDLWRDLDAALAAAAG